MPLVREFIEKDNLDLQKSRFETIYGYIDHGYLVSKTYPEGLLVFMGSYIYKEFRGEGKFKDMVKELFKKYSYGTIVQVPVENKHLLQMFKRLGFEKVKKIEYWGELGNSILMQGIITKETENLLSL